MPIPSCPALLRSHRAWLVWKFEPNEGGGKPRKVPYYVGGGHRGRQGTPRDLARLTTFDEAQAFATKHKFDGVGFAPLPQFGITALDFDNCVTGGAIHPDLEVVANTTYTEFSPSGKGLRAFYQGSLPDRKSHGEPYGFEIFSSKGYVTFTGDSLCMVSEVEPIPPEVQALVEQRFKREPGQVSSTSAGQRMGLTEDEIVELLGQLPSDLDYDDWIKTGAAVHHETSGEGFELWDTWSQRSSKYTTREYGWERWVSFGKNQGDPFTMFGLRKMAGLSSTIPASADDFEDSTEEKIAAEQAIEDAKPLRYLIEDADVFASGAAPRWLIKGVLPDADLVVLYGASGSGKSFVALDMAGALARGVEWRGRKVRQTNVVYVAAEGSGGFRKRVQAYAQHQDIQIQDLAAPLGVLAGAPNLLEKGDCSDLVQAIKARGQVGLVIIDTLAQTTPGANENAGEDMGLALKHCKRITELTGAMVLLIHHAGKDAAKGARGWSGLKAAADAELEVSRVGAARALRVSKQKDGDDSEAWGFELRTVTVGTDEDLEPITSCAVVDAPLPAVGGVARKLGDNEQIVMAAVRELTTKGKMASKADVVSLACEKLPREAGKRDRRAEVVKRAIETLAEDGFFVLDGEWIESNGTPDVLAPGGQTDDTTYTAGRTAVFDVMSRNLRRDSLAFISVSEMKQIAKKQGTTVQQLAEDCFLHVPEGEHYFVSKE